jgi:hypothetical protein
LALYIFARLCFIGLLGSYLAELLLPPLVDVEGESAAAAAEVAAAEEPFPREEVVS